MSSGPKDHQDQARGGDQEEEGRGPADVDWSGSGVEAAEAGPPGAE